MRNSIPGFEEAVAKERAARNAVYLGTSTTLCGFKVRDITPRTLAILTEMRTPFIFGGDVSEETPYVQFILACQGNSNEKEKVCAAAIEADLEAWEKEISDFIALTFLDAPTGGCDEAPIASSCAWLEFRFASPPFNWDYETKTSLRPLRRLYQLARCQDKEAGGVVTNPLSGKCEGDWLDGVNEALKSDPEGTRKILAEIQAREAARRAGVPYVVRELNPTEGAA